MPASARPRSARRVSAERVLVGLVSRNEDAVLIRLYGALVGKSAAVVRSTWTEAQVGGSRRVELDLSGVVKWDLLGLAALVEVGARTSSVALTGASPRLAAAMAAAHPTWEAGGRRRTVWLDVRDAGCQAIDSALALIALLVLAPLLVTIALAIVLDSPGPVFFKQDRSGRLDRDGNVRVIRVFKFRTMVADADAQRDRLKEANQYGDAAFFKLADDPRITAVGSVLRAWSLDELPQLINVARGDMRLVGNRPLPLDEARSLIEPWQRVRFEAPAGVTGLWQVSGRSDVTASARMAMDTAYAAGRSSRFDLAILARTVPAVFRQKGR